MHYDELVDEAICLLEKADETEVDDDETIHLLQYDETELLMNGLFDINDEIEVVVLLDDDDELDENDAEVIIKLDEIDDLEYAQ